MTWQVHVGGVVRVGGTPRSAFCGGFCRHGAADALEDRLCVRVSGWGVDLGGVSGVDEHAGKIRGAGLDVFYEEPLPASSPLYKLDNVLMSAHCADRTKEFQTESMEFFVHNMENYISGRPVENVVDKRAGY